MLKTFAHRRKLREKIFSGRRKAWGWTCLLEFRGPFQEDKEPSSSSGGHMQMARGSLCKFLKGPEHPSEPHPLPPGSSALSLAPQDTEGTFQTSPSGILGPHEGIMIPPHRISGPQACSSLSPRWFVR